MFHPRRAAFFAVQSAAVALLFLATGAVGFRRTSLKIPWESSAAGLSGTFSFEPDSAAGIERWVLELEGLGRDRNPGSASILLNGDPIGSGPVRTKDASVLKLEVPAEALRSGENRLEVSGLEPGTRLLDARLKNFYGYSRGVAGYILIPKANRDYRRPSAAASALAFAALLVLGLFGSAAAPTLRPVVDAAGRTAAFVLLAGAAALPLVSGYRLLYTARPPWLFLVLLNLPAFGALFRIVRNGLRRLVPSLEAGELAARPGRKLAVTLIVPFIVFSFYFILMRSYKDYFGGDYSRFLHIERGRLTVFEAAHWEPKTRLVFENSDFEAGSLENWTPEGRAFLFQPVRTESLAANHRPKFLNQQGTYWVATYDKNAGAVQGDAVDGRLRSAPFTIQEDRIGFLIGGGRTDLAGGLGRQAVALEVDGEVVRESTGLDAEMMRLEYWDVGTWRGKQARFVLIDDPSERGYFRHLNADWFHYSRPNDVRQILVPLEGGYDGQFGYFIAYDPFLNRYKDDPVRYRGFIDEPAYRYGRIGFPLLVAAVSGGNVRLYPLVTVWLILASHFAGSLLFLKIILHFRKNPLWALTYALVPGFQLSLHFGLPESLSFMFLLAGFLAYLKKRFLLTTAAFAASLLFRETGVVLVMVVAGYELFVGKSFRRAALLASSVVPYALWRAFLTWRLFDDYGWRTLWYSPGIFDWPFRGLIDLYAHIFRGDYPPAIVPSAVLYTTFLVGFLIVGIALFIRKRTLPSLTLLAYAVLGLCLDYGYIWVHVDNGIRGTFETLPFLVIAVLSLPEGFRSWPRRVLVAYAGCFVFFNVFIHSISDLFRKAFGIVL
jgi:hypothetical protein